MKNLFIIAAIAVFGLSASANTGSGNKVMVYHNNVDDKYVVSMMNDDTAFQSLEVKDSYTGEVLLSESVEGKDFVQEKVDFNTTGTKVYTVELDSKGDKYEETLVFIDGKHMQNVVNMNKENPDNTKIFMGKNNDELTLSHFNPEREAVEMRIIDSETSREIENQYLGSKKANTNKIDISYLNKGNDYTVAVKEGNTVYYYEFTK